MSAKLIAFYLPQYHVIPENNLWWGEGFTEWERVKSAQPLFKNHQQPKVPHKYYDLMNVEEMVSQAKLAKQYGLFGFCYYHYWFNGKLLLEKPLENMLNCKEVDIPFCLSWANEPWTRAWDGKPNEVLIQQDYGSEKNWLEHLEYLIPFFSDNRYIRIQGKPIFLIYRTSSYQEFDQMIIFWQHELKKRGLSELFITETLNSYQTGPSCKNSDAVVEFEPMFTLHIKSSPFYNRIITKLRKIALKNRHRLIDYDSIWKNIVSRNRKYNKIRFLGAFVNWDNTPRFNKRATVFLGATPKKFGNYLKQQIKKCDINYNYLFINAWNEWAEGVFLEPDIENNHTYLEAIKEILNDSFR